MNNQIHYNTISNFPISLGADITIDGQEYEEENLNLISCNKSWNYMSTVPIAIGMGGVVALNNEIHILGTSHYKWNGTSWVQISIPPITAGQALVFNNEIHILGTSHYKWNGASWIQASTPPHDMSLARGVVFNNEIHMVGGPYSTVNARRHYKWDGTSWTYVDVLSNNVEVYAPNVVVSEGKIHVFYVVNAYNSYHFVWDGTTWTSEGVHFGGNDSAIIVLDDEIHILGGSFSQNNIDYGNRHYNYTKKVTYDMMPNRFYLAGAVVLGDEIHILCSGAATVGGTTYSAHNSHYGYCKLYRKV